MTGQVAEYGVKLHADCSQQEIIVTGPSNVLYDLLLLEPGGGTQTLTTNLPASFSMNGAGQYTLIDDTGNSATYFADVKIDINSSCAGGHPVTIIATVDCNKGEIIVDSNYVQQYHTSYDIDVYFPDGSNRFFQDAIPFSFSYTLPGTYTISLVPANKPHISWTPDVETVNVQCNKTGVEHPCDSITDLTSCVLSLNERYESLECINDKKAEEEKIKLERVTQLLSLAKYDCECGHGYVYRYINEINHIANCDNCDKDYSAPVDKGYGCTDSAAVNYDSSATQDDGSCVYSQSCVSTTMPNRAPWNGASQTETLIPDPLFEAFLELQGMGNGTLDGKVCTVNINNDRDFKCSGFIINDATGIGDMVNYPVKNMTFENNNLNTIDVSQNIDLIKLYVRYNKLTSITGLTNLSDLSNLSLESNQLSSIDLSGNPLLEHLNLRRNNLTSLDISNNPKLWDAALFSNNLTTLDTSNNPLLSILSVVSNNSLSSLDFTNNVDLFSLSASFCDLTTLDVSMCTNLSRLFCRGNSNLATLNLGSNINLLILFGGSAPGRAWDDRFRIESSKSDLNIKVGTGTVPNTTGGSGAGGLQTRVEYTTERLTDLMTLSGTTSSGQVYGAWSQYTITT